MNVNNLTLEMVQSYAGACRSLHDYIGVLKAEGYDLLVVPSRGAHPFLHAAKSHAHMLAVKQGTDLSASAVLRMEALYLPFTADIASDQPVSSSAIRGYWSRVLAAILKGDESDLAYRFYNFVRMQAGTLAVGASQVRSRAHGRFIFVDTVVSGRAINEIFMAFSACGLNECHFVLLIDEGGRKLKSEYAAAIQQMVDLGRATKIVVDKIFTEDEGPAMSGIWTVTMPDLMTAALEVPGFGETGQVAATLFYWEVRKRPDGSNLAITLSNAKLSTLLYSAVSDNHVTPLLLEEFQAQIRDTGLQDQEATKAVAAPVITANLPIKSLDVSGSHVIRGRLDSKKVGELIRQFEKV